VIAEILMEKPATGPTCDLSQPSDAIIIVPNSSDNIMSAYSLRENGSIRDIPQPPKPQAPQTSSQMNKPLFVVERDRQLRNAGRRQRVLNCDSSLSCGSNPQ